MQYVGADGRITLKKQRDRVRTASVRLRMESRGGICKHGKKTLGSIKRGEFLE
jgi:hypothetical protein